MKQKITVLIASLLVLLGIQFGTVDSQYITFASESVSSSLVSIDDLKGEKDINLGSVTGKEGLQKTALDIAESLKKIFYALASIYFIIIAVKLIVASNTDDELQNFKKGIIWITIGIIVMNLATYIVDTMYTLTNPKDIPNLGTYATGLLQNIVYPMIKLLETATAFFFLLVAFFAFFRLVTANGNEEEARRGKMTIFYAIIGFVLVVLAAEIVFAVYGSCKGNLSQIANIFGASCKTSANLSGVVGIIVEIITWLNGFVAVIVILMIIYSGGNIMLSGGEEDKITNAKKSILYIIIGVGILVVNYLILTFFIK